MSTTISTTNDFKQASKNLDASGRNWVMFQRRFTIAVKAKRVWAHFNGSAAKPVPADPNAPTTDEISAIREWDEREDFTMYLISQKLEDLTFQKHVNKDTVAKLWAALIQEFTQKSQMAQVHLRTELMNTCSQPGADLHAEFDHL
jgi:hypothetical protein